MSSEFEEKNKKKEIQKQWRAFKAQRIVLALINYLKDDLWLDYGQDYEVKRNGNSYEIIVKIPRPVPEGEIYKIADILARFDLWWCYDLPEWEDWDKLGIEKCDSKKGTIYDGQEMTDEFVDPTSKIRVVVDFTARVERRLKKYGKTYRFVPVIQYILRKFTIYY